MEAQKKGREFRGTMQITQTSESLPRHALGSRARVLLASVFGPYAQDDEFGGRAINPMELYHNQVTRVQGAFSLRMFHRSWGLMMIQANITAPCTLLDYPSRDRFIQELREQQYDIIGISAIQPNVLKAAEMCRLIRQMQPNATIVVGGHLANLPKIEKRIDADHIVRGEGIRWFRGFLGEDQERPIIHPRTYAGFGARIMGSALPQAPEDMAAALIPSVGCPLGCNFCSTSAMFGGKGKFVNFYNTGDELFAVMQSLERDLKTRSFFVMDENFLLHRERALRLLALMQQHNKDWALYVFSSARVLESYKIEELVGLGISWVWMGLEGENSQYGKLKGVDTHALVRTLQAHGVKVLGSSIIGMEEHTPENIDRVIDFAVSHDTDFHQFMLYTPMGGTPLFNDLRDRGLLLDPECNSAPDVHGQYRFAHRHPNIPAGAETQFLLNAFTRDFDVNGPSFVRLARTLLQGYAKYRNHPEARIRARFTREVADIKTSYAAGLWAASRWFRSKPAVKARIDAVLHEVYRQFGWRARAAAWLAGPIAYRRLCREQERLAKGWRYEPQTSYEKVRQTALAGHADHQKATADGHPATVSLMPEPVACAK
jgi:radical SAM superfamily enzyme YgiQ (UPF0313 family)